jgi:MarR family transcriptional regulator, 2-MHQ and catechol-resistance regulon repressor
MKVQDNDAVGEAHDVAASDEEKAALHLWVVMSRAHAAIAAHAAADVAQHGLTLAEFAILEVLYHRGAMLLGEVQRRILVSSGGVTFLVDRLTTKGLLERRFCPSDRRARYAALTPKGESLMADIFPEHASTIARAMGALSPGDIEHTSDALRALGLHAAALPVKPQESENPDENVGV